MDRLQGLRIKSDRAYKHVTELDVAVRAFLDSRPYSVSLDKNHETRRMEWTLESAKEIPLSISGIVGDALQNSRSALDHLVWQLILSNGGTPCDGVTGFPICQSAQEYASTKFRRKIEGMHEDCIRAIDEFKPYHGGQEDFWRLHSLNNFDKHRLLIPAASAMIHHDLLPSQREQLIKSYMGSYPDATSAPDLRGAVIKPTNALFPLEVGKVFFSIPETEMEHNFKFNLGIAFNEVGVVQGEEVTATVKHLADFIDQVIGVFAPRLFKSEK